MSGHSVARFDEIDELDDGRCPWRPVRHHLGITNAAVSRVSMNISFYAATDCTGSPISNSSAIETNSALNDTSWHQLSGTVLAYPGSKSARINLSQGCTNACAAQTVRYDDLAFDTGVGSPTLAGVTEFRTVRTSGGVRVSWRDGGDMQILGYDVLRSANEYGPYRRMNTALIPRTATGSHVWVDPDHAHGWYRLEVVRLDGRRLRLPSQHV